MYKKLTIIVLIGIVLITLGYLYFSKSIERGNLGGGFGIHPSSAPNSSLGEE